MKNQATETLIGLLTNPVFYIHIAWVGLMSLSVVWFLYKLHNLSDPQSNDRRHLAWLAGLATAGVMNFGLPTFWALQ